MPVFKVALKSGLSVILFGSDVSTQPQIPCDEVCNQYNSPFSKKKKIYLEEYLKLGKCADVWIVI